MTGLSVLTEVNRWVGVIIAVVGAVVVAPEGAGELRKDVWVWLRQRGQRVRGALTRFLPFLQQSGHTVAHPTGIASSMSAGRPVLAGHGQVWDPSAPVEEQIKALRQYITEIRKQLEGVTTRLGQETSDREQSTADLEAQLEARIRELRRLLDEREYQSARIDARGLPVIAFGIVLSGLPDRLAQIPFYLGWALPIAGILLAVTAGVRSWRVYRARPR